jgi:hypothetical protein
MKKGAVLIAKCIKMKKMYLPKMAWLSRNPNFCAFLCKH